MSLPKKSCSECEGCSLCCTHYLGAHDLSRMTKYALEYHAARAESYEDIEGGYRMYKYYQPCPHIDEETGLCKIYEERPEHCRLWPKEYTPLWAKVCKLMQAKFPKPKKGGMRVLKIPK